MCSPMHKHICIICNSRYKSVSLIVVEIEFSPQQHTSEIYIFTYEQEMQQTDVYVVIVCLCSLDICYIDII